MPNPNPKPSKILGALLGVHAGDSLGATLEFMTFTKIQQHYPSGLDEIIGGGAFNWDPGHATDDTDLTRAVLLAYRDRHRHLARQSDSFVNKDETTGERVVNSDDKDADFDVVSAAAEYCLQWMTGDWPLRKKDTPPVDIGGATLRGLLKYKETQNARDAGAGNGSAGNGSLMRCIPTGLFTLTQEERIRESMEISAITHNDQRCTISCAVYNEIISALLASKSASEAVQLGLDTARALNSKDVQQAIHLGQSISIQEMAKFGPGRDFPDATSGFVLQSLSIGIGALLDPRGFEEVLVDVTRLGGDTDTNGAIAGGLLGARDGVEGIPERWVGELQFGGEFREIVREILGGEGI